LALTDKKLPMLFASCNQKAIKIKNAAPVNHGERVKKESAVNYCIISNGFLNILCKTIYP